jgi:membrane protein involved in colicin uptake
LREPKSRLDRELAIYERMDSEQLDYGDVIELIAEERREEIEEALRAQKAQRRAQKAEQKRIAEKIAAAIAEAEMKERAAEARRKAEEINQLAEEARRQAEEAAYQAAAGRVESIPIRKEEPEIQEPELAKVAKPAEPQPTVWGAPPKEQPPAQTARQSLNTPRYDDWGPGALRGINTGRRNEW